MPTVKQIRDDLDIALQSKQSLMTLKRYNNFWYDIAEHWDNKEELQKIYKKVKNIKPTKLAKLKEELKTLRDSGEINKNIKLNQSESKLRDVYDNHYLNRFDNENFFVKTKIKPVLTEHQTFKNTVSAVRFENDENTAWGFSSLRIINHSIPTIRKAMKDHNNLKVTFNFTLVMQQKDIKDDEPPEYTEIHRQMKAIRLFNPDQIKDELAQVISEMEEWIPECMLKNSALLFGYASAVSVNISKYSPMRGGSYIELDDYLKNKKCCINIQNEDDKCLMYCVLYHINKEHLKSHPERVSKYKKYLNQYDFSKIKFPASLHEVKKMENLIDYGINVFCYDNKTTYPILTTDRRDDKIIHLLMIKDGKKEHYVYINKLDILVSKNRFDEEGKHVSKVAYPCPNCLHSFSSHLRLDNHRKGGCDLFEPQKTQLPTLRRDDASGVETIPTIKFNHHTRKFKAPVVIYADFETICQKIEHNHDSSKSNTTKYMKQEPCGYAFNVVSDYPELNKGFNLYRGENTVNHFLRTIVDVGDDIRKTLNINRPMIITPQQEIEFQNTECCHICGDKINDDVEHLQRVRDHDHLTGLYRGCAHQDCNVNFNYKNYKIPVYFHNLKGFDGHLIIKGLTDMNFSNIRIIAQNFEKYMSFTCGEFQFLDSFAFLSSSLDTLSSNLLKDGKNNFKHTLADTSLTEEQQNLILKKGVYPYEYMDCVEKFDETQLPTLNEFYSSLNDDGITTEEYTHAELVWEKFNIQNLGEYHDLYLKTDVLLLTDVFENFRNTAMKYYELDPANGYFTLPNFAWHAMLKMTDIELEQLTDVDMYNFCEKGLRGGTSMISHRYAKANNKYMKDYNPEDISSYIMYLDANNLYGHAMSRQLPYGGFEWINYEINDYHHWIQNINCDDDTGYFVECDLHYPKELHDSHNNYPLAVEKKIINKNNLSPYQLNQITIHNEKHNHKIEKLVPNFYDKERYVCHIKNLKYYIEKGLVVSNIHRVIKFKQNYWLKTYIDFNTTKRAQSNNEFEKDFFKLMNNAVFGKTMENMRNRVDIRLFTDESKALKQIAKPQYEDHKIYGENLIAIKQLQKVVKLDKPIYVGLSVLDLSKLHMYEFHYDYILPKYGENATLLFTDTDSLCYSIKTDDMYKDMKEDNHLFDMSGYSLDGYRSCDNSNKKVIGKFKDETDGIPIIEFCGLRSKMYSILLDNHKEKKVGKGVKKSALKKQVHHEDYKRCLFGSVEDQRQLITYNVMRSFNHEIYGLKTTRIGLSCSNDKQYLLEDGITSYSYGHYKIQNQ